MCVINSLCKEDMEDKGIKYSGTKRVKYILLPDSYIQLSTFWK